MARVDLTVRGGGIFGLACAWEAARRGARVRLIEARAIGATELDLFTPKTRAMPRV